MQSQFIVPGITGEAAVVTGASRGIGAAVARALAIAGARVVLSGRDPAALATVADSIRAAGGTALAQVADITDAGQLAGLRSAAEDQFGPVGLLVANAGESAAPLPLRQLAPDAWRHGLEVNLTGTFLTLREFLPPMMERGAGSAVTLASAAARLVVPASIAYAAAKAGVLEVTRYAAAEAAPAGVRVNAIAPGTVLTSRIASLPAAVLGQLAEEHPSGRLGTLQDVADAVLFLLGSGSSWITGQTLDLGARVMA